MNFEPGALFRGRQRECRIKVNRHTDEPSVFQMEAECFVVDDDLADRRWCFHIHNYLRSCSCHFATISARRSESILRISVVSCARKPRLKAIVRSSIQTLHSEPPL